MASGPPHGPGRATGGGWGIAPEPTSQLDEEAVHAILHRGPKDSVGRPPRGRTGAATAPSGTNPNVRPVSMSAGVNAPFDTYVVLDFEATCIQNKRMSNPEVIEFPFVIVDPTTCSIVAEFQRYVRPVRNPTLTNFCTELTGITQSVVNAADTFPRVYEAAMEFLDSTGLGDEPGKRSYCMVTCGDWDLKEMLPGQMSISGQQGIPASWRRWCNLKVAMKAAFSGGGGDTNQTRGKKKTNSTVRVSGLPDMLQLMNLPLVGQHHSGIDDCRNIAAVLCGLLQRGHTVMPTYFATPHEAKSFTPLRVGDAVGLRPLSGLASSIVTAPAPAIASLNQQSQGESKGNGNRNNKSRENTHKRPVSNGETVVRHYLDVDESRDALRELEASGHGAASQGASQVRTVSKALSYILRHGADECGLPISSNGYIRVDNILQARSVKSRGTTLGDVVSVVEDNNKKRFQLGYGKDDGHLYIAAVQGHSLEGVTPALRTITSATELPAAVHGTYWNAWGLIKQSGYLSPMTRQHIHFAKGLVNDASVVSGMRATAEVLLYLDVERAIADGVPIFESNNGVILTPGVGDTKQLPLCYIAKAVDRKTGASIPI